MNERITVTDISKRPEAYETEVRAGLIKLEWHGWDGSEPDWVPYTGLHKDVVVCKYAQLVDYFYRNPGFGDSRLSTCEEVEPGTWKVEVTHPYLD